MNISYEGIGRSCVTFPQEGCAVGQVCKIGSQGKVVPCELGEAFCGVVVSINGSAAGVQIHGFAEVPYTLEAPDFGYAQLSGDGFGAVCPGGEGRTYLVVAVNVAKNTVTIEL